MKILFNTISENPVGQEADLLIKLSEKYAQKFPEDEVATLISSGTEQLKNEDTGNLHFHYLKSSSLPGPLHFFTEKRIIGEIKKQQADAVLCIDPLPQQKIKNQVFLASPLAISFLKDSKPISKVWAKRFQKSMENAISVIVFSKTEKNFLSTVDPGATEKIRVIHHISTSSNHPLEYEEKQRIKDKMADGNEYFICSPFDAESMLTVTLKGFSGFKKWQKSGMKFVIPVKDDLAETKVRELLSSYRFKDEIRIIKTTDPEYRSSISGAYAAILPEKYNTDSRFLLDAVYAQVPLIIPEESIYSEIMDEAAFKFKFENKEDITRVLLETFREEQKRSAIIRTSEKVILSFTEEKFYAALRKLLHGVSTEVSANQ